MPSSKISIQLFPILVFCMLLLGTGSALAATQYVSDQVPVNLRSGPGIKYRLVAMLTAGDRVSTSGEKDGWTRVQTASGKRGYILTRFLSDNPAARDQLEAMKKKVAALQSNNGDLKEKLSQTQKGSRARGESVKKLTSENKSLKNQLQDIRTTAADAIRIGKQNKEYRQKIMELRSDVERLKHENGNLKSRREGMRVGALILFVGIILGLLLPLIRRQRRRNWDSL